MSSNRFSALDGSTSDADSRRSSIVSDSHTCDEAVEKTAASKLKKNTAGGEAFDGPLRVVVVVTGTGPGFRTGTSERRPRRRRQARSAVSAKLTET